MCIRDRSRQFKLIDPHLALLSRQFYWLKLPRVNCSDNSNLWAVSVMVRTNPINGHSPKWIVGTIPTNRPSPKSIVPTIPTSRTPSKLIVRAIPIRRQNPNQFSGQFQIIDCLLHQLCVQFELRQYPKSIVRTTPLNRKYLDINCPDNAYW